MTKQNKKTKHDKDSDTNLINKRKDENEMNCSNQRARNNFFYLVAVKVIW